MNGEKLPGHLTCKLRLHVSKKNFKNRACQTENVKIHNKCKHDMFHKNRQPVNFFFFFTSVSQCAIFNTLSEELYEIINFRNHSLQ